jgi:hypothetical protein
MKNLDLKTIAIIVLLIAVMVGGGFFWNNNDNWKTKYALETNLKNALQDSLSTYKNKEGEWVSEKKTLQADINTLSGENLNLTDNQENLVKRIKSISKEKDVIAAALANQVVTIDSLTQLATNIDTVNHEIDFVASSDTLEYDITIKNVSPSDSLIIPLMSINKLVIPNEVFIEFHWEKEKLHPISFSMTNSNPLFKVTDLDSYVIPELQKDVVKPTGWKKFGNWFKENGKKIGIFLGGAVVGALAISTSG